MPVRRKIPVDRFARQFHSMVMEQHSRFAFFLGAGCSYSSGIPLAGDLVRDRWLPKLMYECTGQTGDADAWAATRFPEYTRQTAGRFYGQVIEELFGNTDLRQREIDRIVAGRDPAFGYGVLAKLLSHEEAGPLCNVVLTTNFDDLVADALYLHGNARPLVIGHEALIGFVRITRTAPLVVKLHGDHHLEPKNTDVETRTLADSVRTALHKMLAETGLVFIGYSGADRSIADALKGLPKDSLRSGVYWVNDAWPDGDLGTWLQERDAVWVQHRDFDELMLLLHVAFKLSHPDKTRFERLLDEHRQTFETLFKRLVATEEPEQAPLKQAATEAAQGLPSARAALMAAIAKEKAAPDEALALYREAIWKFSDDPDLIGQYARFLHQQEKHEAAEKLYNIALAIGPSNPVNLGNYAFFLENVMKNMGRAERCYRAAVEIDPKYLNALGNYALFLEKVRQDMEGAERYYRAAMGTSPKHANTLGNYALFLEKVRQDIEGADRLYRAALEADPKHVNNLSNYALFLEKVRNDIEGADRFYRAAVEASPKYVRALGNYALFLRAVRQDMDGADRFFRAAVEADPRNAASLGNYALFLETVRRDMESAERYYRDAVEADPNHANNLGNYALFLDKVRGDMEGAERHYRAALEADPKHANTLGNYAWFLDKVRGDPEAAERHYRAAVEADPKNANTLGNYALFLKNVRGDMEGAERHYRAAVEADPKNAINLGNYAVFLEKVRGDLEGAERHYRAALEADPKHAINLGNYALFLDKVRGDVEGAERHYRAAVEADPKNANTLGNYAGVLFARGRKPEAVEYLKRCEREDIPAVLALECRYYRLCHVSESEQRTVDLSAVRRHLLAGVRSPNFDMSANAVRAEADGHPWPGLLKTLAAVIAGQADLSDLDAFPEWRALADDDGNEGVASPGRVVEPAD